MKDVKCGFIKLGAVSPRIRLADVSANVRVCADEAKRASDMGVKVLAFPELTLTGATCSDLFKHPVFIESAERGLSEFVSATAELDLVSFIGLPAQINGEVYNCTAVTCRGGILGVIVKRHLSDGERSYFSDYPIYEKTVSIAGFEARYLSDGSVELPDLNGTVVSVGADFSTKENVRIAIYPEVVEYLAGDRSYELSIARQMSENRDITYVFANAGIGESTTDAVYAAHNVIAYRGKILAEAMPFADDNLVIAEVSLDSTCENLSDSCDEPDEEDCIIPKNPFLPLGDEEQREFCLEALEIQAQGLAARIERSYSKAMVIGVSGGLDSTLALLVCARAADILGMDRKSIIGVTMPCFGTTKRTKSNAEKLCEELGTTLRVVDIKASVTQHLKDIGHDGVTPDVTYENAQARERTQVIMDIANMTGGLVVGTGDLSELVLGWATYNGDHMSMYAVNASVPKTMVRRITEVYSAEHKGEGEVSAILDDILATPVSPELLPPKDGEIAQCTEALVGPYELHDYFIFCTLGYEMSPRETYECAKETFDGIYDGKTILGWLRVFVRRFFSQQFKRSCLPDGPKVSCISVSPRCSLSMPSDASCAVWMSELDEIEKEEK